MKILVVSNYYPPHFVGGYELGCRDVVDQLIARGHEVRVMTGTYGRERSVEVPEPHVQRVLGLSSAPADSTGVTKCNAMKDCLSLARTVRAFAPDVVYFWNQAALSHWIVEGARLLGCRMAFFLSDTCFTSWRTRAFLLPFCNSAVDSRPPLLERVLRAVLGNTWFFKGRPIIQGQPCHFASEFLRQHALKNTLQFDAQHSIVAHWGINPSSFPRQNPAPDRWPPRKLLYVGQLIPQKGVHTAIEALALIAMRPGFEDMSLSIAGGSTNPGYERGLRALACQLGIEGKVHFLGRIDRASLPAIYRDHDVLVFPSVWDEPFAITPLEAMYSMLPVVGTLTGGSGELFVHRKTAMVFEAGNAESCANALLELCSDHEMYKAIRQHGADAVASHHTLERMVDQIEVSLATLI